MKNAGFMLWIAVLSGLVSADTPRRVRPVEEGFLAAGVEGRAVKNAADNGWAFFPSVQVSDGKGAIDAQQGVVLLPCSVLEQIIQLADSDGAVFIRLWAMVTEYRGRNALYSLYFLPIKAAPEAAPQPSAPATEKPKPKDSVLPGEIVQMMQRNARPDLKRLDEIVVTSSDSNLIHRTGQIQADDLGYLYIADAFGQNISHRDYRLLPSKALEAVHRSMQRTPGRQRYVVSGVMTQYAGKNYLLLRRATRTFTNGNFTP